jgi:hypothetical protein
MIIVLLNAQRAKVKSAAAENDEILKFHKNGRRTDVKTLRTAIKLRIYEIPKTGFAICTNLDRIL